MNLKPDYQTLTNRPISCTFCGAQVNGRIIENTNLQSKESEKLCKWQCPRCGNLVRVGKVA